ncbi:hypothetical protein B0O99DRAFT_643585 [Bisporella sp. PMI_857]|nr:hypothetical protein B0O99DRAFT_643585 [Bisporella sp. PMI_857]
MDSAKKTSNSYYDATWRWIEDTYLKYFGENRTSYGVKDTLHKTEVTGDKDISNIQRSVGDATANTLGDKGLLGGVGGVVDKGILRGNV